MSNSNSSMNLGNMGSVKLGNNSGTSKVGKVLMYTIGAVIIVVILVVVIWAIVKAVKNKNKNTTFLIKGPVDAYNIATNDKLKNGLEVQNPEEGLEFTYSLWIYIQDWTRGWKNILVKGGNNANPVGSGDVSRAPGLWLYPNSNSLHARITTYAATNEGCDIKNIPLQKWVHIGYVLNNRTVDMYINGKLERSCVLRGVPKLNDDKVQFGLNGGFFGKLSNVVYYKKALNPDQIFSIYSGGPY